MILKEFNLQYINNRQASTRAKVAFDIAETTDCPLNQKNVDDSKREFLTCYKKTFLAASGPMTGMMTNINVDILLYPLKIKLSDFINHLGLNSPANPTEGAAFYYILNKDSDQNFYFTYGITPAKYQDNQVIPNNGSGANYLVPLYTGNSQVVSSANIQANLNWYNNEVDVRELSNNSTIPVSMFPAQLSVPHPTNTFQDKKQLIDFIEHNNFDITNPPQNAHVRIYHGGVYIMPYGDTDIRVQTSILVLEDENQILLLDNEGFKTPEIYQMKGMNVGRLCPPDC